MVFELHIMGKKYIMEGGLSPQIKYVTDKEEEELPPFDFGHVEFRPPDAGKYIKYITCSCGGNIYYNWKEARSGKHIVCGHCYKDYGKYHERNYDSLER